MHAPTVFCPTCDRYLGVAASCLFCGWDRPAAQHIPASGASLWRLPAAAPADGHPLPLGDRAILADRSGMLAVVSLAGGSVVRQWPVGGALRTSLAVQGKRVYVAKRDGDLLALDLSRLQAPDTSEASLASDDLAAWRLPLASPGAPVSTEGRIYIGNGEGFVTALTDAGDRPEFVWPPVQVGGRVSLAPVPWRRLLLVATSHARGHLVALDAGSGTMIWTQPIGARAAFLLLATRPKGARPAGRQVVVAITDRGHVRAFNPQDGEPLGWDYRIAGGVPVATAGEDGRIYLAGAGGEVVSLDPLSGEARGLADYDDESIIGLAAWKGLLYIATRDGTLHLLDASDGAAHGRWDARGPLTAGPAVLHGTVLVGGEKGWDALPWHLGQWRWAAERYRSQGNLAAAAACHALANEPDAAEQDWLDAGMAERTAWFWTALGDDHRAARAFLRAADGVRTRQPALAATYLNQAADRLEACELTAEAAEFRRQAGRMGRFPHLRLAAANLPAGEIGEPMTAAIEVRNLGNAAADGVRFRLGGRLARCVTGVLLFPLGAGSSEVLEFEGLIPTAAGRERLTVSVTCGGECGPAVRADASFEFDVAEPPGIDLRDDAGSVILRVPKDAPLPRVRVRGMAGSVKVEVT